MKNIKNNNRIKEFLLSFFFIITTVGVAFSEGRAEGAAMPASGEDIITKTFLYVFIGFQILIVWYLYTLISRLMRHLKGEKERIIGQGNTTIETGPRPISSWEQIYNRLNALKPMEMEADLMLDHDYDGIKELDNPMPPWFKWLFYGTIVFAFLYIINYHIVPFMNSGLNPTQEYEQELADAEKSMEEYRKNAADLVDETNVTQLTDAGTLGKGKTKFLEVCAACHGNNGEGGVGPNLTDAYWIHGGSVSDIFKTIKYGIPEKGMISWQSEIKPAEMQALASYIMSLQGSNPANGKEAQGTLYVPASDSTQTGKADSLQTVTVDSASAKSPAKTK